MNDRGRYDLNLQIGFRESHLAIVATRNGAGGAISHYADGDGRGVVAHDYPLEELGPRAFEQLAVALSVKVLGPGVEAFGSGPDGGREATYTGPVNWSATSGFGVGSWDGYVVIQAKQREHPADPQGNAAWLARQIDDEFDGWTSGTSKRGKFPQYIIFVTNVRLSSTGGTGGIDRVNELVRRRVHGDGGAGARRTLKARGLRDWKIWHRDQINALLTAEDGIRRAFPAMLTAGDILTRLASVPGLVDPEQLQPVLLTHARNTLRHERWVNFSEAGNDTRQSVENVIIDVSADGPEGRETTALAEIIRQGDAVLRRSMLPQGEQRHIVLTGNPGNGKSTISRFITQVYRARFIASDAPDGPARQIVDATSAALARLRLRSPRNRRWPIRVDLAELADDLGPSGGKSLLRWLSEKVTLRAEINVSPVTLKRWLGCWPWLLVLDGLDEVTSPQVRRRILDEIESFVEEADEEDADLLVVVTTRPTGYTERIAPDHFSQFDLRYLDNRTAAEYGRLVTSRRLADDPDRKDRVLARFGKQLADPAMSRLMKTPLQVLIMTIILERIGNLPADRYQLFWRYYDTIYDRETAKTTTLATLLTQHRGSITQLHEAVGLTLQIRAETAGDSRALLPLPDLHRLAMARLQELGHDPGPGATALADKIVVAATQRLVLLVAGEDDSVTFEIRSLQELMAARALTDAVDEEISRRLFATAPSPHWRNTWVFAAGRLFAEGPDHRRDLVVKTVESADAEARWPAWLCPVGPEFAADLLDDGLAATTPKWQRRLIDVALRSLTGPVTRDLLGIARGLTSAAAGNNLMHIRGALKTAFAGTPQARAVAAEIVRMGEFGSAIPGSAQPAPTAEAGSQAHRGRVESVGSLLGRQLAAIEESPAILSKVETALTELKGLKLRVKEGALHPIPPDATSQWPRTLEALRDPNASLVLDLLCGDLDAGQWQVQELLATAAWPELSRSPVGRHLKSWAQGLSDHTG